MTLTPEEMDELRFLLIMAKMKQNSETLRLRKPNGMDY